LQNAFRQQALRLSAAKSGPGSALPNAIYTPSQLVRALARVRAMTPPARVTRVNVAQGGDGTCVVTLIEEHRDPTLNVEMSLTLTAEETRAWRAELRRAAAAGSGPGSEG
jgi:hypothetical protein